MKTKRQKRVLIVDDHEAQRLALSVVLKIRGLEVFMAKNGEEGVHLYKEHKPDVVVFDYDMPKMDGLEMYEAMKALGRTKAKFLMQTTWELEIPKGLVYLSKFNGQGVLVNKIMELLSSK